MRPYGELGASWPLAKATKAWLATPPFLLILRQSLGLPPWAASPLDVPSESPHRHGPWGPCCQGSLL